MENNRYSIQEFVQQTKQKDKHQGVVQPLEEAYFSEEPS